MATFDTEPDPFAVEEPVKKKRAPRKSKKPSINPDTGEIGVLKIVVLSLWKSTTGGGRAWTEVGKAFPRDEGGYALKIRSGISISGDVYLFPYSDRDKEQ